MNETELRAAAECHLCRRPFGNSGPIFWRITLERHVIDAAAIRRQDGLGAMLGHSALAQVMGPNEAMTKPMQEPITITVCEGCAGEQTTVYDLGLRSGADIPL